MKQSLMILLLWAGMAAAASAQTAVEEHGQLSVAGKYVVDKDQNPVQLRGMSLFWSQWQGKYYTYNTVKWLRDDWKCTLIRAAMGVSSSADGYMKSPAIALAEKQKVKTVVDAAIDLGMYVIIDWHTHDGLVQSEKDSAIAFFSDMAKTYKDYPNVIYEIFNEPLDVSWTDLKTYSEDVIAAIRVHDADNIIVCGTPNWSQDVDAVVSSPITKYSNIAYTLHYYAASHKQYLRDKALEAINKDLCLIVTEFGTCHSSGGDPIDAESSALWFDFMDEHKLSWCNWSVADKKEAASIITYGASIDGGWSSDQITLSGKIIRDELLFQYYIKNMTDADAPIMSSQPAGATIGLGMQYQLSAEAVSLSELSFQWYRDAVKIEGATSQTLPITGFDESQVGKYHVVVTNKNGGIHSDTVTLSLIIRSPYKGVIALPGILQAEDFDKGGNGYTYSDAEPSNQGGKYRTAEGVDIEASEDGGFQIGYSAAGEWLEYTVSVAADGDYSLTAYVASMFSGGKFEVGFGGYAASTFTVPNTASWTKRTTVTNKISLKAGEQTVRVNVLNAIGYNLDKIDIQPFVEEEPATPDEIVAAGVLAVYPNPAQDIVTVGAAQPGLLTVVAQGATIFASPIDGEEKYSLQHLAPGAYIFKLETPQGIYTQQIIKQ